MNIKNKLDYNTVSHELLLLTMPFGMGWLSDTTQTGDCDTPCHASVVLATTLYTLRYHGIAAPPEDKTEIN